MNDRSKYLAHTLLITFLLMSWALACDSNPTPVDADTSRDSTVDANTDIPDAHTPNDCDEFGYEQAEVPADYTAPSLEIDPAVVNPAATHRPGIKHVVSLPRLNARRDQLFLFFPGSGSAPNGTTHLLRVAAYHGYHVIGLAYSNAGSVSDMCRGAPDSGTCHGEVISERLYGDDHGEGPSNVVTVDPANSILQRLQDILRLLDQERPGDGWDQFMDSSDTIQWNRIVLSGASQGGKTATYLSRDVEVARAVLFNAFGSATMGPGGEVVIADWSLAPRMTPASRIFGLWHEEEAANVFGPILLEQMGVNDYGNRVDVDLNRPPYHCTHMLRTRVLPATASGPDDFSDAHPAVGADHATPLDDEGVPILSPVWTYMMTAALPNDSQ